MFIKVHIGGRPVHFNIAAIHSVNWDMSVPKANAKSVVVFDVPGDHYITPDETPEQVMALIAEAQWAADYNRGVAYAQASYKP